MKVHNNTPFPAVAWKSVDAQKKWHLTTLTRVKYQLCPTPIQGVWELRLTPNQGELFGEDIYYDNDLKNAVRYESDYVTYKPNSDIILNANTHAPAGKLSQKWSCGVQIINTQGELIKETYLNITGQCLWEKRRLTGWKKNKIIPVTQVPTHYGKAYGGTLLNPKATEKNQPNYLVEEIKNPVGCGVQHKDMPATPFFAHQITWQETRLDNKPYPAGLSAINRAWKIRLDKAGTYDQHWIDHQHPYPPFDFSYLHNQAANPELVLEGYIELGAHIVLKNLLPDSPIVKIKIPELYCFAEYYSETESVQRHRMNIDTVLIDIDHESAEKHAIYLSYRHFSDSSPNLHTLHMSYLPKEQLEKQHG